MYGGTDASIMADVLREVLKKVKRSSFRREMTKNFVASHKCNIKEACTTFGIILSCYRYQPKFSEKNDLIAKCSLGLAV